MQARYPDRASFGSSTVFIRSENLFLRPAWPEDRPALRRLNVPSGCDPLASGAGEAPGMLVTIPDANGPRTIGSGVFRRRGRGWQPLLWLAPAWRHLGLYEEAEDALAALARQLPGDSVGGDGEDRSREALVAA